MVALELEDADLVKVDEAFTRCNVDEWQRRVSVFNEADEENEKTAADIASEQVDKIYIDPGTADFFETIALEINAQDSEVSWALCFEYFFSLFGFTVGILFRLFTFNLCVC